MHEILCKITKNQMYLNKKEKYAKQLQNNFLFQEKKTLSDSPKPSMVGSWICVWIIMCRNNFQPFTVRSKV